MKDAVFTSDESKDCGHTNSLKTEDKINYLVYYYPVVFVTIVVTVVVEFGNVREMMWY